jgi:RNA polymerase sigma-70 factor (ECF subfamily)
MSFSSAPENHEDHLSPSDSDERLAAAIRTGDHHAFTTVFLGHYDALCRFAQSYLRNTADAEEIVESVLARIWEQHETFDPQGGIAPYLYSAVRNRALNSLRDSQTRDTLETTHHASLVQESGPQASVHPTTRLEQEELGLLLHQAIESLPDPRSAIISMRWFGGLKHAEIARVLGISANAVEIQLRRALKELSTKIPEYLRE